LNIEEYISTGILEAYALGDLSAAERAEVEKNLRDYPALQSELRKVEDTFEALAFKAAVQPSPKVKEQILSSLITREAKVIPIQPNVGAWKWSMAASVAIALMASYLAYDYRSKWLTTVVALNELIDKNQQVAQDYNQINLKLEKIQGDFAIIENSSFTKVILNGTANSPEALASVYWNASSEEAYLSIQNLKQLSKEQQFQLWAIVDGKPVDAGVFDADFKGLLKMKNIKNPSAFAVTIEPRGGKPSPTLETMQVLGSITKG
jgi:Uncharacterized protein conserved in bacteria